MPLEVFDPDKHHIGLGPAENNDLYGFIVEPPYHSEPQRLNAPPEYGTEDQTGPRVRSRWSQSNFGGGAYQKVYGSDTAMFADCDGIIPAFLEQCARTVAPLEYWAAASTEARPTDAGSAKAVFTTDNKVAAVFETVTYLYDVETGARVSVPHAAQTVRAACHDPGDNYIYSITRASDDTGSFYLRRYKQGVAPVDVATAPAGMRGPIRAIIPFAQNFLVVGNTTLWLADVNDDRDDAKWTKVGRIPGQVRDAVGYNGLIYFLCTDGQQVTTLHAWDGQQILPVTDIPSNFLGTCLKQYGGRLFVGGSGTDTGGDDRYAEFYEVLGSSLRQVFSFSDAARLEEEDIPHAIYSMAVHEGLLWMGTDQDFLIVYDITRDGIFNGPRIRLNWSGTPANETMQTRWVISTREKVLAFVNALADSEVTADGFYRLATKQADLDGSYTCSLTLSEFAPEPDRLKRWSQFEVVTRHGTHSVQVSVDGGATWDDADGGVINKGDLYFGSWSLASVALSNTIRIRITMPKTTVGFTELISTALHFLFLDTGKWAWSFTINGALNVEAADESLVAGDAVAMRTELRSWVREKTPLRFRDVDGLEYEVTMTDFVEAQPIIAPPTTAVEPFGREGFYRVVLTEV